MDIAQAKRKENIAEYILYLWQLEDLLRALQFSPEAIYSRYHYTPSNGGPRRLAAMGTLLATAGYQTTFGRLLVDGWFGGGPAVGIPAETGYHHGFQLWKWLGTRNDNIAMSFSIRIGYCF